MSGSLKYTLSKKRKHWVAMLHPGLLKLVKIIKTIPFDEYSYDGECLVSFDKNDENKINTVHIEIKKENAKLKPYMLFGGICYNILHEKYTSTNINNFLDYTGDIDVRVYYHPSIQLKITSEITEFLQNHTEEEEESTINCVSRTEQALNPYIKHYVHWLLGHIQTFLTKDKIKALFPKCKTIQASDIHKYLKRNSESQYLKEEMGFEEINIDNLAYLLCFMDDSSIRIQLILSCGMAIDHALEFIFVLPSTGPISSIFTVNEYETMLNNDIKSSDILEINAYQIQSTYKLMSSNIDAYTERVELVDNDAHSHKAINHMARMIYLLVLAKRNPKEILSSNLILPIRGWLETIIKKKKSIIFYAIDKKGAYQKTTIEIGELLTAFQSILKPKQFIQHDSIYKQIKVGKSFEEDAFRSLMTLVNGNRFNKQKSMSTSKRSKTTTRKKRTLLRKLSTRKTKKQTIKSI